MHCVGFFLKNNRRHVVILLIHLQSLPFLGISACCSEVWLHINDLPPEKKSKDKWHVLVIWLWGSVISQSFLSVTLWNEPERGRKDDLRSTDVAIADIFSGHLSPRHHVSLLINIFVPFCCSLHLIITFCFEETKSFVTSIRHSTICPVLPHHIPECHRHFCINPDRIIVAHKSTEPVQ